MAALNDFDLRRFAIPEDVRLKKDCVSVESGMKLISNIQLYYQEACPLDNTTPSAINVLLLHGRMFSSKTWLDLGTIQILAAMGFRTLAVDLPGYGNSQQTEVYDKAEFLHSIIQEFGLIKPVIISPSMSGFYSLPYLLRNSTGIAGYVPVAPVGIEILEELPSCRDPFIRQQVRSPLQEFLHEPLPDLSHIKTPTMVVYGEKDRSRSSALLSLLPVSQCQEIPGGSHPAYLDNPDLWHQLLYNFLDILSKAS